MTQYGAGGEGPRHFFLLTPYNFKNIRRARAPPPPRPPTPRSQQPTEQHQFVRGRAVPTSGAKNEVLDPIYELQYMSAVVEYRNRDLKHLRRKHQRRRLLNF